MRVFIGAGLLVTILLQPPPAWTKPTHDFDRTHEVRSVTVDPSTARLTRTSTLADRSVDWTLLPAVFTTAETGFGATLYGEINFLLGGAEQRNRRSKIDLGLTGTERDQLIISTHPTFWWGNNRFQVMGDWVVKLYPNRFYGVGNNATASYQGFTERRLEFQSWMGIDEVAPRSWTRRHAAFASCLDFISKSMGLR